jgi:hypothetical protein
MSQQPLPKDNDDIQPVWSRDDKAAVRHRLGADPPLLEQSVEQLAGEILERHGISPEMPDAVVAAYGWAACQYELGLLVTQRLQEVQDYATLHDIAYAEAMFQIAETTRFKNVDARVSRLRAEIGKWEDALMGLL